MDKRWYVIHTYSGHENKVKHYIEGSAANDPAVVDKVEQVVVPTEEVVEMKDGRKTTVTRKFLPSYVLVKMEMTKEALHFITNVPGVTNFVGPGKKPVPLRDEEVDRILGQIDRGKTRQEETVPYRVGDKVKVIDGPFSEFLGTVDDLNAEKSKIKVMVSIFGRNTPVELDVLQVEPFEQKEQKE